MTIAKIAAVPHWKVIMQSGTSDDREGWAKTREVCQRASACIGKFALDKKKIFVPFVCCLFIY